MGKIWTGSRISALCIILKPKKMKSFNGHSVEGISNKCKKSWEYMRRAFAFPVGSQALQELFGLEPKSSSSFNVGKKSLGKKKLRKRFLLKKTPNESLSPPEHSSLVYKSFCKGQSFSENQRRFYTVSPTYIQHLYPKVHKTETEL
jgi:hypothetical protein